MDPNDHRIRAECLLQEAADLNINPKETREKISALSTQALAHAILSHHKDPEDE